MSKSTPEVSALPSGSSQIAAGSGGQASTATGLVRSSLRGLDLATQMKALAPRQTPGRAPVQRKEKQGSGDAAGAAQECYVHTADMSIPTDCPEGGQAALDAQAADAMRESEDKAAASVAWDGPLAVRLMGFEVGKSALGGVHRQALEQLRSRTVSALTADPRILRMAEVGVLPGDEPPWWEAITSITGSASPEGKEEQNTSLAIERAGATDAQLCELGAGRWQSYQPELRAEPHRDRKTPKGQWPALRSATVRAEVGPHILADVVVPPREMADAAGDQLSAALPEPVAPRAPRSILGGAKRGEGARDSSHEVKGGAGKKPPPGAAKKMHEVGVTFSPDGTEVAYKRTLEKSWPFPLAPGVFAEMTISGSIGGTGAQTRRTIEGALTGELAGSLTLNGGVPEVASIYGGGGAKVPVKGTFTYDSRTKQANGKAKGALVVEAKIGAKASVGIPKSWLPSGWDPLEVGFQYEYKPGGEWEVAVLEWDEGDITFTEGKDLKALKQAISDFIDGVKNLPASVGGHLANTDPLPHRRGQEGVGTGGLGGRNLE